MSPAGRIQPVVGLVGYKGERLYAVDPPHQAGHSALGTHPVAHVAAAGGGAWPRVARLAVPDTKAAVVVGRVGAAAECRARSAAAAALVEVGHAAAGEEEGSGHWAHCKAKAAEKLALPPGWCAGRLGNELSAPL